MAYDPQANRRRPQPEASEPAPVEALLGDAGLGTAKPITDDPPPSPVVTPAPADPPSDTVLINTTVAAVIGAIAALLLLRQLWNRRVNQRAET